MPPSLTPEQIERYNRSGVLFPIPVLSPEQIDVSQKGYDELMEAFGRKPKSVELAVTHLNFPWAYQLVTHPAVLDAVEGVLGRDLLVWASSIFAKPPHDPGYITFHQDATYWGLDSPQVTTAWIALSPSTVENGCMRVVPRTHAHQIHPHKETWADDNMLSRGQEIQVEVNENDVVDVVLKPGEMSLHHVNIIHGSNPNPTDIPRIGFATRYITPKVKQIKPGHPAILARGEDHYGHYELMKEPPALLSTEETLGEHLAMAAQHAREITTTTAATPKHL